MVGCPLVVIIQDGHEGVAPLTVVAGWRELLIYLDHRGGARSAGERRHDSCVPAAGAADVLGPTIQEKLYWEGSGEGVFEGSVLKMLYVGFCVQVPNSFIQFVLKRRVLRFVHNSFEMLTLLLLRY
jgi:hypothetical protein